MDSTGSIPLCNAESFFNFENVDTGSIAIQIVALIILVSLSAFFSASETAFLTFSKSKMKTEAEEGNKKAKLVMKLNEKYDKLLSTILVGNNIVNILATSMATVLFTSIITNGDIAVTISTVVMTLLVLLFGEITPKTLAKKSSYKVSKNFVKPLNFICAILTPLTYLFNLWQKLIVNIVKDEDDQSVTEEEIITVVEEAAIGGEIDEQESELIKNVIRFSDLAVNDILTPRVDVVAVEKGWDRQKIAAVFSQSEFSRLPVYDETIDNIIGILYQKDFYSDTSSPVSQLVKPVKSIFTSMKISKLLRYFQETNCHMVVVNDEYGGTAGIVTLEDVLESIVGEIYDEHDEVVEDIVTLSDTKYKVLGSVAIDKFMEFFELEEEIEDSDVTTFSGFVAHNLGEIPEEATFEYKNLKITITNTDANRLVDAEVEVFPKEEPEE
ncbi:MAG: HlyC/CorC family transporter [Clostridia bacterium]|nr:HlyC/CorC family transporter [Clostridia bacterium]